MTVNHSNPLRLLIVPLFHSLRTTSSRLSASPLGIYHAQIVADAPSSSISCPAPLSLPVLFATYISALSQLHSGYPTHFLTSYRAKIRLSYTSCACCLAFATYAFSRAPGMDGAYGGAIFLQTCRQQCAQVLPHRAFAVLRSNASPSVALKNSPSFSYTPKPSKNCP